MPVVAKLISTGEIVASRGADGTEAECLAEALQSHPQTDVQIVSMAADELKAVFDAIRQAVRAPIELRASTFTSDTLRAEMVAALKNNDLTTIESYIRNKLNAAAVVDLATAQAFCNRVETAFVQLAKVLALVVSR